MSLSSAPNGKRSALAAHAHWHLDSRRLVRTTPPPLAFFSSFSMSTQVATATLTNGVNGVNGASKKIKSKNQLRRLKAKQKKAEEKDKSEGPVRVYLHPKLQRSLTVSTFGSCRKRME